jgi:hypothetical protein
MPPSRSRYKSKRDAAITKRITVGLTVCTSAIAPPGFIYRDGLSCSFKDKPEEDLNG